MPQGNLCLAALKAKQGALWAKFAAMEATDTLPDANYGYQYTFFEFHGRFYKIVHTKCTILYTATNRYTQKKRDLRRGEKKNATKY